MKHVSNYNFVGNFKIYNLSSLFLVLASLILIFFKGLNFGIDFNKCLSNEKIENYILEDRIDSAKKFEINSTPTLIINNKKFDKTLNYKNLKKSLEKLI